LLQRTPTEGSYQQSLFEEFFFIYNVCLTGRAGRPGEKTWEILGYGFQDIVSGLGISTLGPGKFYDMVFRT